MPDLAAEVKRTFTHPRTHSRAFSGLQPPNSLLSDALITRLADGVYIHTRQIMVGNSVQMESTRTRRITGENLYFESEDDAPPLDTSLV